MNEPTSGWLYLAIAATIGALGLVTLIPDLDFPSLVPVVLLTIAGLLGTIGTTAVGVTIGLRRADWLRRQP